MKLRIEISDKDLKKLVVSYLNEQLGRDLKLENVRIETKSKQNYKSEWEQADFRCVYESNE